MKIYLTGPMSNNPNYELEFQHVEDLLHEKGHIVINPVNLVSEDCTVWEDAMKADLVEMLRCDAVAVVHTCQPSKGQALEILIANQLDIPCKDYQEYL